MQYGKACAILTLLLATASAQAQLYKWVAPDGTVSYSDTPPPANATQVERKNIGKAPSTSDMPFDLATATKGNPVTLYTMAQCQACDSARKTLNDRGVPFTEKTVSSNEDVEQVKRLSGANQLPFVTIGRNKLSGFEPGQWTNALTAAGYPTSNKLPKTYRNPAPEPVVPPANKLAADPSASAPPANKPADAPPSGIPLPPPATGKAPPGFQF